MKNIKITLIILGIISSNYIALGQKANECTHEITVDQMVEALKPRTYCRFVPERYDDFAFENNYIAMRVYGPALIKREAVGSGVDCWMKRVEYPIINKWYKLSLAKHSHHIDRGEGWDGYKVGESAGAGGSALWIDGKRVELSVFKKWKILENTPEHCAFLLTYEKEINGSVYREEKKISLGMNTRLYKAESTFFKDGELATGLPVCVGLTNHGGAGIVSANIQLGWISCWEVMADGYGLGTAATMPPQQIKTVAIEKGNPASKSITGHILLIAETDKEGKISFSAGYGWERAGTILSQNDWSAYLTEYCANEYK
ncbi:DUF4861 family protein [Marinilabilia sp.]